MKDRILSPAGILCIYLLLINLAAFLTMGWDKWRSKKEGARRVPEKRIFLLAVLGGSLGATAGMFTFRHKTLHWYFRIGLPLILVLQIVLPLVIRHLLKT